MLNLWHRLAAASKVLLRVSYSAMFCVVVVPGPGVPGGWAEARGDRDIPSFWILSLENAHIGGAVKGDVLWRGRNINQSR